MKRSDKIRQWIDATAGQAYPTRLSRRAFRRRQPVGGLYLFVWVIPTIDEAIATHSRLENIASIIAILLAFILLALLHVIWALGHIHAALVRNR